MTAGYDAIFMGNLGHFYSMAQSEKRIPVSEDTFEELGVFKGAGETWNDVVQALIERSHKLNRHELIERTADDEYVPLEDV